jgi:hypothetical protein
MLALVGHIGTYGNGFLGERPPVENRAQKWEPPPRVAPLRMTSALARSCRPAPAENGGPMFDYRLLNLDGTPAEMDAASPGSWL